MAYVKTDDGVRIYYEEHGKGTPLALAYGVGGNADMWEPNVAALSSRHRLILWEPRGHARSGSPRDPAAYSMRRWALDLRAVLDGAGARKAYVGGLSLGGGVATRFARLFPARARGLIVVDSASCAGLPQPVEGTAVRVRSIQITLAKGMRAMGEYAVAQNPIYAAAVKRDPSARAVFRRLFSRLDPVGYASSLRALLHVEDFRHELDRLRLPTLMICGDLDPALASMKVAHAHVKGSRLEIISPAGHFSNRDRPEQFNRTVLDLTSRLEARR